MAWKAPERRYEETKEIVALIAYLQRLGTDIQAVEEVVEE